MTEPTNTPKIHRTCKLGKIKECDVSFDTNIKAKLFCCDDHRYRWHNNLKTLFRRMVKIEDSFEDIKGAFTRTGKVITEAIMTARPFREFLEKLEEAMKDKK